MSARSTPGYSSEAARSVDARGWWPSDSRFSRSTRCRRVGAFLTGNGARGADDVESKCTFAVRPRRPGRAVDRRRSRMSRWTMTSPSRRARTYVRTALSRSYRAPSWRSAQRPLSQPPAAPVQRLFDPGLACHGTAFSTCAKARAPRHQPPAPPRWCRARPRLRGGPDRTTSGRRRCPPRTGSCGPVEGRGRRRCGPARPGRAPAVLCLCSSARPRLAGWGATCGPTGGCGIRATSRWPSRPARRT